MSRKNTKRKAAEPEPEEASGEEGEEEGGTESPPIRGYAPIDTPVPITKKKFKTYTPPHPYGKIKATKKKSSPSKQSHFAPRIPGRDYKLEQKNVYTFKFTYDETKPITLSAASEDGILLGEKKGKPYLKLTEVENENRLESFHQTVDAYTDIVKDKVEQELADAWGITEFDKLTHIFMNGDQAWQAEPKNQDGLKPREVLLFPHLQWTKVYDYETKTGKTIPSRGGLSAKVGKSANSKFTISLRLKAWDITYNPSAGIISYLPWIAPNQIIWINEGQDANVDEDAKEARKKDREAEELSVVVAQAKKYLDSTKKTRVQGAAKNAGKKIVEQVEAAVEKEKEGRKEVV
jgi:hypothetical protein